MTDWPHPTHDPEGMDALHGGDVCPWCGKQLKRTEEAVHAETGNEVVTEEVRRRVADVTSPGMATMSI